MRRGDSTTAAPAPPSTCNLQAECVGTFMDPATGALLQREWTNAFYNFDNVSDARCSLCEHAVRFSCPLTNAVAAPCCAGGQGLPDAVCDRHSGRLHAHHVCHNGLTVRAQAALQPCAHLCSIGWPSV